MHNLFYSLACLVSGVSIIAVSSLFSPANAVPSTEQIFENGRQLTEINSSSEVNIGSNFGLNYAESKVTSNSLPLNIQTTGSKFNIVVESIPRKIPESSTTLALGVIAIGAARFLKRNHISA